MAPFLFVNSNVDDGNVGAVSGEKIILFCPDHPRPITLSCKDEFQVEKQGKTIDAAPILLCAGISSCRRHVAAADGNKKLYLWKTDGGQGRHEPFEPVSCRPMSRKAYKVIFTNRGSEIVVADRGGDVYAFAVDEPTEAGRLILGHISIILDMCLSPDDKYLLTCDREGKIRVSNYPNCYNIHTYCLGHEEFVSSMCLVGEGVVVSGSGDGSLTLWDYKAGAAIGSQCLDDGDANTAARCIKYSDKHGVIAALMHPKHDVLIYKVVGCSSFRFVQCLNFDNAPLDARFDGDGRLWVIVSSESDFVKVFQNRGDKDMFEELDLSGSDAGSVASELCKSLVSFPQCPFDIEMSSLYKQHAMWDEDGEMKEKISCKKRKKEK